MKKLVYATNDYGRATWTYKGRITEEELADEYKNFISSLGGNYSLENMPELNCKIATSLLTGHISNGIAYFKMYANGETIFSWLDDLLPKYLNEDEPCNIDFYKVKGGDIAFIEVIDDDETESKYTAEETYEDSWDSDYYGDHHDKILYEVCHEGGINENETRVITEKELLTEYSKFMSELEVENIPEMSCEIAKKILEEDSDLDDSYFCNYNYVDKNYGGSIDMWLSDFIYDHDVEDTDYDLFDESTDWTIYN